MNPDNYLVTGASGFLGSEIKNELLRQGLKVLGLSRNSADLNLDISVDFRFPDTILPEVIVHAAGKAHSIPRNQEEVNRFYSVNLEGTKNLCKAIDILKSKPSAFVFISTVAVYGLDKGLNIHETHLLNGKSPYARSKIEAESFLQDWAGQRNIPLTIFRLPLVMGASAPGNLGAMVSAIKRKRYFRIGKGSARKSIVLASDVASFIPSAQGNSGIFNLTDGYHPSFAELEDAICHKLKLPSPASIPLWLISAVANTVGRIPGFPVSSATVDKISSPLTFNDELARRTLGWKPRPVLDNIEI